MSDERLPRIIHAAVAEGVLSASVAAPAVEERPWPVVLLTGLGAWLAALPLLGVVGSLFGEFINRGPGLYVVAVLLLSGAVVVLRARDVPLFVEQLAVPALLVGGASLGFALARDSSVPRGAALLCVVALGVGVGIARPWLRVLLGAAAALALSIACVPEHGTGIGRAQVFWFAWHVCIAVWLGAAWVQRRVLTDGARAPLAAAIESLGAGWMLATLAGLAWWSGMTLLVGASAGGGFAGEVIRETARRAPGQGLVLPAVSLVLAAAAAFWAARRWPRLRTAVNGGVALVMLALAWFMPALGAVLLALALTATTLRWRLAMAAALTAAWIVGAFYYQLQWPLASKALLLLAAGAALGVLAWFGSRSGQPTASRQPAAARAPTTAGTRAAIVASVIAVLAVANFAIWQKEDLIANGRPVFVELAPVDPRSLMQGDFMQLNFRVPGDVRAGVGGALSAMRPRVVAQIDARGVATLLRIDEGAALAADQLRIELTPKAGRWTLVTDAWFFKEGEAKRWEGAKYGEFRVEPGGRALLVGLRGAKLEPL